MGEKTTQVVTHQGRAGRTVDLCRAHEATVSAWIGVDYHGVSRGLGRGVCAECELARTDLLGDVARALGIEATRDLRTVVETAVRDGEGTVERCVEIWREAEADWAAEVAS